MDLYARGGGGGGGGGGEGGLKVCTEYKRACF